MLKHLFSMPLGLFFLSAVMIDFLAACGTPSSPSQQEEAEMERYENAIIQANDSGNFERVLNLSTQYYEASKQNRSLLFQVRAASTHGQNLVLAGNTNEAKTLLDKALSMAIQLNIDTLQAIIFNGLGMYELFNANDYAATEYFIKALEKTPKEDKRSRSILLCHLGSTISQTNDTIGKYTVEFYELSKEIESTLGKTLALSQMACLHHIRKEYKQEEELLLKAYEVAPPSLVPSIDANMAKLKIETHHIAEASRYADHAIAVADTCKGVQGSQLKDVQIIKAHTLSELGQFEASNQRLDKLMEDSANMLSRQKWDVQNLYTMNYKQLGRYNEALEHSKRLTDLITHQTRQDRVKILKAKEVALDVAKKDAEIEHHRDHAHLMEWLLWGAVAFIVLLAAMCFYIYIMYRRQRKLMTVVVERAQTETVTIEQKKVDDKHVELFRRIKEEIDDKKMFLDANLSRESLAKHLGTNRTYISEAVAQMTGMNFPQYINLLRINEAERRLHDPQVDVSNFANFGRTLGFASLNAFRTAFKQQTGMTLSAYREIARAKAG